MSTVQKPRGEEWLFGRIRSRLTLLPDKLRGVIDHASSIGWHECDDRYCVRRERPTDLVGNYLVIFTLDGEGCAVINGTEHLGVYVRYFYGTTNDDFSNIAEVYESYIDRMPLRCIPVADADFGNQICISLQDENYGKIYFWDHETMDTDYEEKCYLTFNDMVLLADSFEEFLDKIIPFDTEVSTEGEKSLFDRIKKIFKR